MAAAPSTRAGYSQKQCSWLPLQMRNAYVTSAERTRKINDKGGAMQKPSAIVLAVALAATAGEANVSKDSFGTTAAGQSVDRYTLEK